MASKKGSVDFTKVAMMSYKAGDLGDIVTKNMFAYDGYNPEYTFNKMVDIAGSSAAAMHDVKVLCCFMVQRGNKPRKAIQNMPKDGRTEVQKLIRKYNIIESKPTRKEDMTIARIAGISPRCCADMIKGDDVDSRTVGTVPPKLPRYLAFVSAPALIPEEDEELFEVWLHWAKSFNKVVNNGKDADKVEHFGRIVQRNSCLNTAQRLEILSELDN